MLSKSKTLLHDLHNLKTESVRGKACCNGDVKIAVWQYVIYLHCSISSHTDACGPFGERHFNDSHSHRSPRECKSPSLKTTGDTRYEYTVSQLTLRKWPRRTRGIRLTGWHCRPGRNATQRSLPDQIRIIWNALSSCCDHTSIHWSRRVCAVSKH